MEVKKDRRVTRSKRNIKNAFISLIEKKEINQITITELSALADVDRKTFYFHYDTVEDVYKEIVNEVATELNELISTQDFTFNLFFKGLNKIMENDMQFYKVIVENNSYSFLLNECVQLLNKKLTEKYEKERPITDEFRIKISYASYGIIGVYITWLKNNQSIPLDLLTESLSRNTESLFHYCPF